MVHLTVLIVLCNPIGALGSKDHVTLGSQLARIVLSYSFFRFEVYEAEIINSFRYKLLLDPDFSFYNRLYPKMYTVKLVLHLLIGFRVIFYRFGKDIFNQDLVMFHIKE